MGLQTRGRNFTEYKLFRQWADEVHDKFDFMPVCFCADLIDGTMVQTPEGQSWEKYSKLKRCRQTSQNLFQEFNNDSNEALHLLMCPVVIILTCDDPKFSEDEMKKYGNVLTFMYRSTKRTVTLKTDVEQYSMEADDFTEITSLDNFIIRLSDHYIRMGVKDFRFQIKLDKESDELNVLQKQFTLVQKRLLVQYGSLPPGDCDPLEYLMKDTIKV
ncbi:unnamed protein product [Chrysodeixis includens]|uniref:Uncharacterized protein n=1 Tax=Chrysodeixis includens TaxID=689277 RepID=A0A9N8PXA3_CHRIL|nr:unnamed protein product [Chrysodeixis includens]